MGSPFGDPIFMPALSWRDGSARLRRYGTRMAGAGGGAGGSAVREQDDGVRAYGN